MRALKTGWSRSAGLFIVMTVMTPFVANADTEQPAGQLAGQNACPALLMEQECHDYQTALHAAQSAAEIALLEDKYAALLKERARLCPHQPDLDAADAARPSSQTKRARLAAGRKISM
ncbi:MAG: hypothetical protein B7Y41_05015 [Hydrogenophilales bacterium 28-61-23]|nr:MAG: hypothetical protein B7Y41_05015 [Hydrogenophilales bacterium 28-61-23]